MRSGTHALKIVSPHTKSSGFHEILTVQGNHVHHLRTAQGFLVTLFSDNVRVENGIQLLNKSFVR